ncbi:uncharacterized protein LOC144161751 [Haemaphysalis longicornis]
MDTRQQEGSKARQAVRSRLERRSASGGGGGDSQVPPELGAHPVKPGPAVSPRRMPERKLTYYCYWRASMHQVVVGTLLLAAFLTLQSYYSPAPSTFRDAIAAVIVDEMNAPVASLASALSPFDRSAVEAELDEEARRQLGASERWRQTHTHVYTCGVFLDRRPSPQEPLVSTPGLFVRFLVLAPTTQLVPSHASVNASVHYECLFLKRNWRIRRGTYFVEAPQPDGPHHVVYRNGSALVQTCVGTIPHRVCTHAWGSEVLSTDGQNHPVGGVTSAPYEPVHVDCPVPVGASERLASLVYRREESAYWFVPRHLNWTVPKRRGSVAICVTPWSEERMHAGGGRDLAELLTYYAVLGVRHFVVYINVTDQDTVEFLRTLKNQSRLSLTYRSWPGVPAANRLAFAEPALVMDCVYSHVNTAIDYVVTVALREFILLRKARTFKEFLLRSEYANATSLTLLSQPMQAASAEGDWIDLRLEHRERLRLRLQVDPPGTTSRVLLRAKHIVEADAANAYQAIQANSLTADSDEATVLRYEQIPEGEDNSTDGSPYGRLVDNVPDGSSMAWWWAQSAASRIRHHEMPNQ